MSNWMIQIGSLHSFFGYYNLYDTLNVNGTSYQVPSASSRNDWQACLIQPNYVYSNDATLNYAIATIDNDISELNTVLDSLKKPRKALDLEPEQQGKYTSKGGPFMEGLAYVGNLVTGMTLMGQLAVFISWKHPGWLISAACFGLWCSLLSFSYYNSDPPLPVPTKTNATLLIFLGWLNKSNFDNVRFF